MKKNHLFPIFIILLLGLAYYFWFDFKNNLILFASDYIIPLNPSANLKFLTTWIDNDNGSRYFSSYHYLILFYNLLSKFSLSLTQIQFIQVYLIHVIGALGIYYLTNVLFKEHPEKILVGLLGAILYLFSPAFLNIYFASPSIAFVPLALAVFTDGLNKKHKFLYALGIGIIVSLGNLPDPHPRPFFLILVPIILLTFIQAFYSVNKKGLFSYLFLVFLYIFLLNSWYFLGLTANILFAKNLLSYSKDIPITFGLENKFPDEGSAIIGKMYRLFHDGVPISGKAGEFYLSSTVMTLLIYLQPILAFSTLLFLENKRKIIKQNILFLICLAIFFLFLAKSVNPPLGAFYRWSLNTIPIFRAFRTSAHFILGTAIAYSILIPLAIIEISKKITNKHLGFMLGSLLFLVCLVSSYPLIFRYPAYFQPDPKNPAQLGIKIPHDFYRLNNYLKNYPEDAKVITLPLDPGYEVLSTDPSYFGIPMLPYIIDKPVINQRVQLFGDQFSFPLVLEQALVEENSAVKLLANLSNIRFLIVKHNATGYTYIPNLTKITQPSSVFKNFTLLKKFGHYSLYENKTYSPHFYIPNQLITSQSEPEKFTEILAEIKLKSRPAIYFSIQNKKEQLTLLNNLKLDPNHLPIISYKKINQTKFLVTVKKATSKFLLIFSETFSRGWKTSPNLEDSHLRANGFANSWIVDPKDIGSTDFEILIEYYPQKMSNIGYAIAGFTFLLSVAYFIYVKSKKN